MALYVSLRENKFSGANKGTVLVAQQIQVARIRTDNRLLGFAADVDGDPQTHQLIARYVTGVDPPRLSKTSRLVVGRIGGRQVPRP